MQLDALQVYCPDLNEPSDFEDFWQSSIQQSRQLSAPTDISQIEIGLRVFDTFDVTFSGFDGERVKAWLIVPKFFEKPIPVVFEFVAYGGGRGNPFFWLQFPAAGYAHFVMDNRGQGSSWMRGDTPDLSDQGEPAFPGYMTRGISNPENYYYRRALSNNYGFFHVEFV